MIFKTTRWLVALCCSALLFSSNFSLNAQCTSNTILYPAASTAVATDDTPVQIEDCNYTEEYSEITGLAAGDTYEFSCVDDFGVDKYVTITDVGGLSVLAFGPSPLSYSPASSVDIEVYWNDDAACGITTDCHITTVTCTSCASLPAPANDECSAATMLTPEADLSCSSPVSASTAAATQSLVGCTGTANDDVWFTFTATSVEHSILITNTAGDSDIVTEAFDACGGTSLVCQDSPDSPINLSGLTIGSTYTFRVFT
ncbi:MAG: hypothetical protein AB8F78_14345 [Saprospiraceae bacterium]